MEQISRLGKNRLKKIVFPVSNRSGIFSWKYIVGIFMFKEIFKKKTKNFKIKRKIKLKIKDIFMLGLLTVAVIKELLM